MYLFNIYNCYYKISFSEKSIRIVSFLSVFIAKLFKKYYNSVVFLYIDR